MKTCSFLFSALFMVLIATAQPVKTINNDSVQIRNSVLTFYNWYNKNYAKLQGFTLYTSVKTKEGPPYKINWKEAERYFVYLLVDVVQHLQGKRCIGGGGEATGQVVGKRRRSLSGGLLRVGISLRDVAVQQCVAGCSAVKRLVNLNRYCR